MNKIHVILMTQNSVRRNCYKCKFCKLYSLTIEYFQLRDALFKLQVVLQLQCNNGFFACYWIAKISRAMETLIFLIAIVIDQATHELCNIEVCLMFRLDYCCESKWKKFVVDKNVCNQNWRKATLYLYLSFSIWWRTNRNDDKQRRLFFFLFWMMIRKMRKTVIINNIFRVFIACRSLLRNPNEYWLLNKV